MNHDLTEGDRFIEMPGSTFSRTWEVTDVDDDGTVIAELVDQAVGYEYATETRTERWGSDEMAAALAGDVIVTPDGKSDELVTGV